jgi:hypothetical protein
MSTQPIHLDGTGLIASRLAKRRMKLGEHQALGEREVKEILILRQ